MNLLKLFGLGFPVGLGFYWGLLCFYRVYNPQQFMVNMGSGWITFMAFMNFCFSIVFFSLAFGSLIQMLERKKR